MSQERRRQNVSKDIVFIAAVAEVEAISRRLATGEDLSPGEALDYRYRRATLLTYVAEETGDSNDRALAMKAWDSLRALDCWGSSRQEEYGPDK